MIALRYFQIYIGVVALNASAFAASVDFARDVLPILSDTCYQCHGPDPANGRKGDLRLDDEADVKKERDGYFIVKPGDAKASELIKRLTHQDPEELMPPPKLGRPLSEKQIATLGTWIDEGAEWGKHWAFERPERPAIFVSKHPVDALIDRQLKAKKVTPTQRASRETLIRRLSLDLTGLPPSPEQIAAFIADNKAGAWSRLVDRTLASPAYGERMAWDWLDAARYADTNGYQGDAERSMWPWRDWVVDAFNKNLPYDTFTVWQLAGDLLPDATNEQILATAFNRNHMINGEGGRIPEENRVDYVFDMAETMGTVWLGLTLNCCRCHDHKFDPITQAEYYQFNAFFNQTSVNGGGGNARTPPVLAVPSPDQQKALAAAKAERVKAGEEIAALKKRLAAASNDPDAWQLLEASAATAKGQTIERLARGLIYTSGNNPDKDEYEITYPLKAGEISGFKLDALRHPKMTGGGLARSNSGNFVLTDIAFEIESKGARRKLKIAGAEATFEQGSLKITNTFDNNPGSGWAVHEGRFVDKDHAGVFRLGERVTVAAGDVLQVSLKFNSQNKAHNLGHFRISSSAAQHPKLKSSKQEPPELVALQKKKAAVDGKIKNLEKSYPQVMVMKDQPKRRPTYILSGGLYSAHGAEVKANTPAALPALKSEKEPNRLELARWLVAPENPLTARVTVNRFWQMLFGIGLVKTSEDFGVQAEYPLQRELLDWLAVEFVESGWDVKQLMKTMVTSEAYRRSSEIASREVFEADPENRLHARGPRFRMPSWMIRDQALAASGLLNSARGGPSVNSYQPAGIWSEATFGKKKYKQATGDALYRRSLYTYWRRIVGPAMFFDNAKRQVCEIKPLRTNTPMHALNTLNNVTYVEAARNLAQDVLSKSTDDAERLQLAGKRVLGRALTEAERAVWKRSLTKARDYYRANPDAAKAYLANGASARDAASPVELAAWAAVCLNVLNLDEALTKE